MKIDNESKEKKTFPILRRIHQVREFIVCLIGNNKFHEFFFLYSFSQRHGNNVNFRFAHTVYHLDFISLVNGIHRKKN